MYVTHADDLREKRIMFSSLLLKLVGMRLGIYLFEMGALNSNMCIYLIF
jgi:hypothetical protein